MKLYAQFVGGKYNQVFVPLNEIEEMKIGNGKYTEDLSEIRARGGLVHRAELDNCPCVDGYTTCWDGFRYWVEGRLKSEYATPEEFKVDCNRVGVIRYETWEVYNMMST